MWKKGKDLRHWNARTPVLRSRSQGKYHTCANKPLYLSWFLNWATDRGYNTNLAYKKFRPTLKMTQRKVIYLTKDEIARVRDLEISEAQAYLDPIRDIFLFCCFSGLRHSDVNNLRRSDVKGDHIEVTTVKTADSISIELNKITKAILEKYKDTPFRDGKGRQGPAELYQPGDEPRHQGAVQAGRYQ